MTPAVRGGPAARGHAAARPADHEEPTLIPDDPESGSGLPEPPLDGDARPEWAPVPPDPMLPDEIATAAIDSGDGNPPISTAPGAGHGRLARFGAGLLSAIVPGLGHLVTGRRRLAALFLAPVVLALLVLVGLFLTQNTLSLAASLIDPSVVGGILVLEVLFLVWRVAAVVSSMVDRSFPRFRVADGIGLLVVLALVVLPQAGIAVLTSATQAAESNVFVDEPFPSDDAGPSIAPSLSPGDSFFPSAEPSASASSALPPRVTVLLIGVDSGVGRNTAATDTMIVASLDPVAKTVSMVSVPRDLVNAPLPKGKTFSPKINGLVANVRWNPGSYPGYNGHGQAVLAYSLGKMLGVHIDYYAQVDLEGFVQAVNAVGGVDVSVDHAMCDARYNEYGFDGYSIGAGRHHMNGNQALAYARIRKSVGESDFTRAARQQQVVVALKDKVVKGGFLNDPLGLLRAVGQTIQTNIPPGVVRQLAPLATEIGPKDVYRAVVSYPLVRPGFDARGSIQLPNFDKISALGAAMFTSVGTRPADKYAAKPPTSVAKGPAQPAPSCAAAPKPRPKPKPTPRPTPKPTPKSTPSPTPTATEPPPTPTPTSTGP